MGRPTVSNAPKSGTISLTGELDNPISVAQDPWNNILVFLVFAHLE